MKLRSVTSLAVLSALLLLVRPSPAADAIPPGEIVAHASHELVVRAAYEDGPLLELIHRAQLAQTQADISLASPLPVGARLPGGPITAADAQRLVPGLETVELELSGEQLRRLLEESASRFAVYDYQAERQLLPPGDDSALVTVEGASYEIDLTRPPGDRILHLSVAGAPLDSSRLFKVAATLPIARRLLSAERLSRRGVPLGEQIVALLRRQGTLDGSFDRNWALLPDYVSSAERAHVDRLVRLGVAPKDEVHRLGWDHPARRGDLAYWLSRAFGWRESRLSGAFGDVPDSLEPWLDGLVKRRILGQAATEEAFRPFAPATLPLVLEWCEAAARHASYDLQSAAARQGFRRGLLAGTSLAGRPETDTLTRSQLLGLVANARYPELRVLATSDLHGALHPRDRGSGRKLGGIAALAAHIRRLRAENPEGTVLLDGGDLFQGTMLSNAFSGRPVVEHMNHLGYVASAIGNHEFDWSVDTLAARVSEMRFAALGANVVESRRRRRPWWAGSDTVFSRRGVRIGVLGLAYPRTPSVTLARNVQGLRFESDSLWTARLAPALRRQRRAEVVVWVGHVPATQESTGHVHGDLARLAAGIRGVDLWLGGHSHTRVQGVVAGIPVLVPGSHGEIVAVGDLVVDPLRDQVVERRTRLALTWVDEVVPDSTAQEIVSRWQARLGIQDLTPIGHNRIRLRKNLGGESPIGNLVADVMREAAGADIALQNNGGLRAELPEGPITPSLLFEVIPFDNEIVTLRLSGAEVRQALEEGLVHERVVQVSGLRYRFDLGRPAGQRVTELTDEQGRPLDPGRSYLVACNDYMAQGGDDLMTLARAKDPERTGLDLRDTLEEWVRRRGGTLEYQGDGRVSRVPGSKRPARGE